jgi:hypothetical protein
MSDERRWRPRSLFVWILRRILGEISNGRPLGEARQAAATLFLEKAAHPGLDTPSQDVYRLALDWASILKTATTRIAPGLPPQLQAVPAVRLAPAKTWQSAAHQDVTGRLHLWDAVETVNDQSLSRLFHSWKVIGELAATGEPMTLHLVEVGRQVGGRQMTAWCRAYAHPVVSHRFAFQQKTGKPLVGKWKPVFFNDRNDPDTWVEMMARDEVTLYREVPVKALTPEQAAAVQRDIVREAEGMETVLATDWRDVTMRRTSCDSPHCVWQELCYG